MENENSEEGWIVLFVVTKSMRLFAQYFELHY